LQIQAPKAGNDEAKHGRNKPASSAARIKQFGRYNFEVSVKAWW
jgi:hypothetical protein